MCASRVKAVASRDQMDQAIAEGQEDNGLIRLLWRQPKPEEIAAAVTEEEPANAALQLWHRRLGHLNEATLKKMAKEGLAEGLPSRLEGSLGVCTGCKAGEQTRDSFPPKGPAHKGKDLLEVVSTDICGPMREWSASRSRCFLTFQDDFSKEVWVYFLKEKGEAFKYFKIFKAEVEN